MHFAITWEGHYKNAKDETKATYSPSHSMIGPVILFWKKAYLLFFYHKNQIQKTSSERLCIETP